MNKWLRNLSERDRLVVYYGSIICALLLFFFMFWSPLTQRNAGLVDSNANTRELIGWMQKTKSQLAKLHQQEKNKTANNVSLLSAIEQSVKRNRLDSAAGEIKQVDSNRVNVSFPKVDYLAAMRWIEDVQVTSASKIDKVAIQKTETPGLVRLDVTLLR